MSNSLQFLFRKKVQKRLTAKSKYESSVLLIPYLQREEALAAREKFMSSEGDHISLLNIFKAYKANNGNKVRIHQLYCIFCPTN